MRRTDGKPNPPRGIPHGYLTVIFTLSRPRSPVPLPSRQFFEVERRQSHGKRTPGPVKRCCCWRNSGFRPEHGPPSAILLPLVVRKKRINVNTLQKRAKFTSSRTYNPGQKGLHEGGDP